MFTRLLDRSDFDSNGLVPTPTVGVRFLKKRKLSRCVIYDKIINTIRIVEGVKKLRQIWLMLLCCLTTNLTAVEDR